MSEYYNVTTNAGDAAIATAIANNNKLNITHVAFGDGNGSVPTPDKTRSALVHEVHRQAVTKYTKHPSIANYIVIETIIPSSVGGFWIREMGIIADNVLISHGSHAPFFKVSDPDGVSEYRLKFTQDVRDGSVVEIVLDESLIYASQAWVNENYIRRNELIDNLTTDDASKPLTAKQGKKLQEEKADLSGATFTGEVVSTSPNSYRLKDSKRSVFWRLDGNNFYLMKTADDNPDGGWDDTRPIMWDFKKNRLFFGSDVEFSSAKGNLTGNADTATKLNTPRNISFSGAATGSFNFDGSANTSCLLMLANSGVAAGTYASTIQIPQITVNSKGLITSVSQQNIRSATTEQSGVVQLVDDLNTDDKTKALTAAGGKWLNDQKLSVLGGKVGPLEISAPVPYIDFHFNNSGSDFTSRIIELESGNLSVIGDFSVNGALNANASSATKLKNIRKINNVDFDGTSDITVFDQTKFEATGQTAQVNDVAWNAKSGVYTKLNAGVTQTVVHFLGAGSAPALQLLASYANGGLFYRSARDTVGFENDWQRIVTEISGVASLALKLLNTRTISFSGAATGSFNFDGSTNASCLLTLANSGVAAGTYASTIQIPQITVNSKGLITSVSQQNIRSATTEQSGVVQLVDDVNTDDKTKALTAAGGKWLNDKKANLSGATFTGEVISTSPNSYRLKNSKRSVFWRLDSNNIYLMKTADDNPDGGWDETRPLWWDLSTNYLYFGSAALFSAGLSGNLTGNASTSTKLETARNIAITGAVSGSANFDGSGNITISTTANNAIGVGQSWSEVTSSRAVNTTYTNTTGKPIQIMVTTANWNNAGSFELVLDGVSVTSFGNQDGYNQSKPVSAIVPNGSTYRVNGSFTKWSELR
ncbi:phage tail protein [Acinetobacter ursingii]|uniref:phage tail protein n=1 Tax=Acinetobacter ursingii TaxID=108980 RepID=UPI0021CD437D|nr:phage tail protein [Acinetobacter ursingii]